MKKLNTLLVALLTAATATLSAQQSKADLNWNADYKPYPYVFIGVQGGAQTTLTPDYAARKLFTPTGAFSVGAMFSPAVGARANVNGWRNKGGLKDNQTYFYNYAAYSTDLLVNLSAILWPSNYHSTNLYLIGGAGINHGWQNREMLKLTQTGAYSAPYAWDHKLFHNFRVGAQVETDLSKNIAFNLEVNANHVGDRYNSKVNGVGDWQLNALIGLTFKFGHKKFQRPAPVVPPVVVVKEEPKPEPPAAPAVVVKEEPKPEPPVKVLQEYTDNIFFNIGKTNVVEEEMVKVERIATWLKAHPTANVTLNGYADAKTGNPALNQRLSELRTAAVKKLLIEKYGIEASRITSAVSHGDKEQPFTVNEQNRVVVTYAKETR